MFRFIDTVLTPDELYRQNKVWDFLNNFDKPIKSVFDCKIVSILNNSNHLDPIRISKINTNIKLLTDEYNFESKLTSSEKSYILDLINDTTIESLLNFSLPIKTKISKHLTNPKIHDNFEFQTILLSDTSLFKFETLLFDNNVLVSYNKNESFSKYLYKNLLHYFNVSSLDELDSFSEDWRIKLLKLIRLFNFNNFIVTNLFYENTIKFNEEVFDVSFVPKYDVNSINPKYLPEKEVFNRKNINYYETFNPKHTEIIPTEYRILFKTFPFKNGFYINHKSGQIKYIDYPTNKNESTKYYISDICNIKNIDYALSSVAEILSTKELMSFIIYSSDLKHQGLALMILRIKIGSIWKMDNLFTITLPWLNDVFGWCKIACNNDKIILPLNNPVSERTRNYIKLIKHIEDVAENKLDVSFLCSGYLIPPYESKSIFDSLTTDCQKYIFSILLLQEYHTNDLYEYILQLNPEFHSIKEFDFNEYEHLMKRSSISVTDDNSNIKLLESGNEMFICSPLNCMEKYRFTDDRLNQLVLDPFHIELNSIETCRYISLLLNI